MNAVVFGGELFLNLRLSEMNKSEIRKIRLANQKRISAAHRECLSGKISKRFFSNFDLTRTNFLHCFLPIEKFNEIDTRFIFRRIWRDFPSIETLAPRVDFQTNEIENLKFAPEIELVRNAWAIDEPTGGETVETKKIDVVLVPLLAFDARGFRVGYGRGFYDRFLKNCRADCLKIGLSYFAPVEEISDAENFDVKLNFCVTPHEVIQTKI